MNVDFFSRQVVKQVVLFTVIHLFLACVLYVLLDTETFFPAVIYCCMSTCKLAGAVFSYLSIAKWLKEFMMDWCTWLCVIQYVLNFMCALLEILNASICCTLRNVRSLLVMDPTSLQFSGCRGCFPGGKAAGVWSWPLTSISSSG
jgi:hypothetical protein